MKRNRLKAFSNGTFRYTEYFPRSLYRANIFNCQSLRHQQMDINYNMIILYFHSAQVSVQVERDQEFVRAKLQAYTIRLTTNVVVLFYMRHSYNSFDFRNYPYIFVRITTLTEKH